MVKRLKMKTGLGFCALMLGLSGYANSACYIVDETNALGVQEDSGQGNYNCAVLTTPDGVPMENLIGSVADYGPNAQNPLTIDWWVDAVDTDVPPDGTPDSRNNVYLVSTFNKGQGKRCNYLYEAGVSEGAGLGAIDSGAVETVTVCGEPEPTVLPPAETGIVTTLGEECTATYVYDGTEPLGEQLAVSFGFTAGSVETITACASYEENTPLPGLSQMECAPPPYPLRTPVPPTNGDCSTPNLDGSYPLSCAPVEYDAGDLKYCWYYENRVCETGDLAGYCEGRIADTYIPKTKKGSLNITVDVMDGSTCYTYYLRGRAYHHCY